MKSETLIASPAKSGKTAAAKTKDGSGRIAIRKILAPTDFSPASTNAVRHACRLGELTKSELIFINVIEPTESFALEGVPFACIEELKANAEENLRGLVQSAREAGIPKTTSLTRSGIPAHEIVEAAKELDVDLIVIAAHGYTGWKHFCIGSTAERVVRAAPCAVMTIRQKEYEFS